MKRDDGLFLRVREPEVARNLAVVLVHLAVPRPPVIKLAAGHAEPADEAPNRDFLFSDQAFTKSMMPSRVSWGTHAPFKFPKEFF